MLKLSEEKLISLRKAAGLLPRRRAGKSVHVSTLYRWSTGSGFRGIRLEVLRVGSTLCTSAEALDRFFQKITEADENLQADSKAASRDSGSQREEEDRLDELGL